MTSFKLSPLGRSKSKFLKLELNFGCLLSSSDNNGGEISKLLLQIFTCFSPNLEAVSDLFNP